MACQDDSGPCSYLKEAFYDTERMMSAWSKLISQYPTQLYYSVLPFLPIDTYLACHYQTHTRGISILRGQDPSWSPLLFTLTGPPEHVIAFAPKGQIVALAYLSQIDLFDALSGMPLSSIVQPESPDPYTYKYVSGVTFNADASEVTVARSWGLHDIYYDVVKYDVTRQIGHVHRTALLKGGHWRVIRLSAGGSYVAFPEFTESERRICIWRTDGGDDTFISMRHRKATDGVRRSLSLSADSAHLVAVAIDNTIIVSDVLSGNILQTLDDEGVWHIFISPDGSFLASASQLGGTIRLWSMTRGTLLATLENPWDTLAFSHANRLYMALRSGGGSVCDVLAEHDRPAIVPFPFPNNIDLITLAPNDAQIAIRAIDTQIWSLRDTQVDSGPHSILSIDLSSDASLLAISAETKIEVWDVPINRCRYVIQRKSASIDPRPIAFSPRGELIVSSSRNGIIVIDVQTGMTRPTTYMTGQDIDNYRHFGISFDDSTLAASTREFYSKIRIWDLPSGTHLHTISDLATSYPHFRWSRIDPYLMYSRRPLYLNAKTFQEEVLSDPGDRFQEHDHLRRKGNMLRIRSPPQRKDRLFLALPSHLSIMTFRCRGDRVSILTKEGQLLLLDISGLDTYMKEFCVIESGELGVDLLNFAITVQSCR